MFIQLSKIFLTIFNGGLYEEIIAILIFGATKKKKKTAESLNKISEHTPTP